MKQWDNGMIDQGSCDNHILNKGLDSLRDFRYDRATGWNDLLLTCELFYINIIRSDPADI